MDWDFPTLDRYAYVLGAAALFGSPALAAGPTADFHVAAGHAPQTLREFYLQSQVRVLYLADTVRGVQTQAVSGQLEASDALARMLEGTGLTFEFEGEHSVVVKQETTLAASATLEDARATSDDGPLSLDASYAARDSRELEEVLVTGSLIHGVFDITSPLIPIGKQAMKKTAYATTQDAVQVLPLAATVTRGEVVGGIGNYNRGVGINLRGLGDGATLVLVNGRRQPMAGTRGDFVDVSNVPWSMVERIEVLPDGGSALYGSDAVAGVVNIILRQATEGVETQMRYGVAPGGATELLAAQLLGHEWDSGHWLAGYQYYERTALAAGDRPYSANTDKTAFGGRDFRSISSTPGNILDPFTFQPAFAIPSGQNGSTLSAADLQPGVVNQSNQLAGTQLLPHKHGHNLYLTGSQQLSERVELFADARFARRDMRIRPATIDGSGTSVFMVPASNPFFVDPFGGMPFVIVAYDFRNELGPVRDRGVTESYFGTLGLNADLGSNWRASVATSYGAERLRWTNYGNLDPFALDAALADPNPTTAFNPFGDGAHGHPDTIADIGAVFRHSARSEIVSAQLTADGPLFDLPSGAVKMAVGAEYRQEHLRQQTHIDFLSQLPDRVRGSRQIAAAFTELSVPLIGSNDGLRAQPRLELSLAGRYERYDDFGHTYNPRIGLRFAPWPSMKLRASWGTSFRAPSLIDLDDSRNTASLVMLPDPRSPSGRSMAIGLQGGNPNLDEEHATTWTAGIDLAPAAWPGLQLSLTAYAIEYENQVIQPGPLNPSDILFQEDQWSQVITRNPSQAQIDALCTSRQFVGMPGECSANSPTLIVDIRKRNLAITKVQGLDLQLQQSFDTDWGHWHFDLSGTKVFHFKRALSTRAPTMDVLDTVNNPLGLRLRGSLEWHRHGRNRAGLGASLSANYAGSYADADTPVRRSVDDWTTFDLGLSYRVAKRGTWLDDTEVSLNVVNALNEAPPFVDREWGYDIFNAQPYGRVFSAYVSKHW